MRYLWFYLGKTLTYSRISLYSQFAKLLATLALVLAVLKLPSKTNRVNHLQSKFSAYLTICLTQLPPKLTVLPARAVPSLSIQLHPLLTYTSSLLPCNSMQIH